jgi:hypothetical protein
MPRRFLVIRNPSRRRDAVTLSAEKCEIINTQLAFVGIPHGDALASKMGFRISHSEFTKVKNTCREDGISKT